MTCPISLAGWKREPLRTGDAPSARRLRNTEAEQVATQERQAAGSKSKGLGVAQTLLVAMRR